MSRADIEGGSDALLPSGDLNHTATTDDDGLMLASAKGSRSAFDALMARHEGRLRGYLRRLLPRDDDVDDVSQEIFLEIWRRRQRYEARGLFSAWLYRIARSHAASRGRRRRLQSLLFGAPAKSETPEDLLSARTEIDALAAAVDTLPTPQREVVVLRHTAGLDHRAIAVALGISEANTRQRYARAMATLRTRMEALHDTPSV